MFVKGENPLRWGIFHEDLLADPISIACLRLDPGLVWPGSSGSGLKRAGLLLLLHGVTARTVPGFLLPLALCPPPYSK